MRDESIGGFLQRLASREPTPGGGAVAALHAAQAAALLGMGARFTVGPKYVDVAGAVEEVMDAADLLRERALLLAAQDEEAFAAVGAAYAMPRDDEAARSRRRTAVQDALAGAAQPPAGVVAVARELVALAERLLPVANPTLAYDVAAAADAAYAAASTGRFNVEANLKGLPQDDDRRVLLDGVADVDEILERAVDVRESVRKGLFT